MTKLVQQLSKSQAVHEIPRVVLGLIYGTVTVFLPYSTQRNNVSADITFSDGTAIALHPKDYEFVQSELVPFFYGRSMRVTESHIRGRIELTWPSPSLGPVVPGTASELPVPEPVEIP